MQEREKSIIGMTLAKPDYAYLSCGKLMPEYFTNEPLKEIFKAMQVLYENDKAISISHVSQLHGEDITKYLSALASEYSLISSESNIADAVRIQIDEITAEKMKQAVITAEDAETISRSVTELQEERERMQNGNETRPENMREYISKALNNDMDAFRKSDSIKTGFKNYDEKTGGLFPGLYVIGAISSLGKTTFIHHMCDNIAGNGRPILFFSLEQSTLELVTKSIARLNFQQVINDKTKSKNIGMYCTSAMHLRRYGINTDESKQALDVYNSSIADNMNIIQGNFNTSVQYIRSYVKRYLKAHEDKPAPVVVVDYLQVMQGNGNGNIRNDVDHNVTELKRISRDFNICVIVISSFNRSSYITPVSFESFKESGGIEYTADVVLGLQLRCLSQDEVFKSGSKEKITAQREKAQEEKKKIPRELELVCIKNRYGETSFSLDFDYNPRFDYFYQAEKKEIVKRL